jgi:hypothetical protein
LNCSVLPVVTEEFAGVTAMDTRVAPAFTVTVTLEVIVVFAPFVTVNV